MTNNPRSPADDDFEDEIEQDVEPLEDSEVPADVLAEFNAALEAAVADWGDELEDYITDKQGEPK